MIYPVEEFLEVEVHDKLAPLLGYVLPCLFQNQWRKSGASGGAGLNNL